MKSIKIGYSPCPNDTFIFAALSAGKIDSSLRFETVLADVETLNQWSLEKRLHVTKLSFFALGKVRPDYALLHAGSALGFGCGPLLVARPGFGLDKLSEGLVAAPGELTTARLLLSLYNRRAPRFKQMIFSNVMPSVARGDADFGLIIHEGRFTYHQHGLEVLLDLGQWWETEIGAPIPLGGIAIRRDLGEEAAREVDEAIRASLDAARKANPTAMPYVMSHAQEMDPNVAMQHIELYVNEFSRDLGEEGERAVRILFQRAEDAGLMPDSGLPLMAY